MGSIQAARKNLFLEGFIPSSQRVEDILSSQVDDNIAEGQPRLTEFTPRDSTRARLSGDQFNFVAPASQQLGYGCPNESRPAT